MSFQLISEVLAYTRSLPIDALKPADRLLLLAIAERSHPDDRIDARGRTIPARTCFPDLETLCKDVGLHPTGLKTTMQRLAAMDLEVRVPKGTDSRGRTVYAYSGQQREFRLPDLEVRTPVDNRTNGEATTSPSGSNGEATASPSQANGEATASRWWGHSIQMVRLQPHPNQEGTCKEPSPQAPQRNAPGLRPVDNGDGGTDRFSEDEQAVIAAGVRPELAAEVLALAQRDPDTTSPVGRIRASAQYRQQLTEQIEGERKQQRLEVLAAAERSERGRCDHDTGGLLPTQDGKPRCPICRHAGATALALHDLTDIA